MFRKAFIFTPLDNKHLTGSARTVKGRTSLTGFTLIKTAFLILVCLNAICFAKEIKKPNVSGTFYPASKLELISMIDGFLEKAHPQLIEGKIKVLVCPHAGYVYCAQTAAYAYKLLAYEKFDTVIIIAPSHYMHFDGFSVYPEGAFQTPLGEIEIDTDLAKSIISKNEKISFYAEAYDKEHSVEVQLPFLQRMLPCAKIVPIICGNLNYEDCNILADAVAASIRENKKVLIIASTDLSHYHSYLEGSGLDKMAVKAVEKDDPQTIFKEAIAGKIEMCGLEAVVTAKLIAEKMGAEGIKLLRYANSGDVTMDKNRVVGYAAMAFYKSDEKKGEEAMLNENQRKKLLEIARESIRFYAENKTYMTCEVFDDVLKKKKGAFVTLTINGQLRGCIGHITADAELYKTILTMAVEAAYGDPRFNSLTQGELDKIKIEISVLSELKKIDQLDEIEVGTHGLLIRKGFNSGLLLPQVAEDYGWGRQEFLENVCYKAGLKKDAYKEKADIYIFSAEVFGED